MNKPLHSGFTPTLRRLRPNVFTEFALIVADSQKIAGTPLAVFASEGTLKQNSQEDTK